MYILGIQGNFGRPEHDSDAVLIHDNELVAAVEEERLIRYKCAFGVMPDRAIRYCLKTAGITMKDVDVLAFPRNTWTGHENRLKMFKNKTSYIPKWNQEVFEITQECLNEGRGKIESDTDFVRILTGSRSKRISAQTFHTFGLLKGYKRFYLKAVVQLLGKQEIKDLASYVVLVGEEGNERNIATLLEFLSHEDGNIRRLTCSALGKLNSSVAERPLIGMLFDPKPQVRQYTIKALGEIGTKYSLPILKRIVISQRERDYNIAAAKEAIMKIQKRNESFKNEN